MTEHTLTVTIDQGMCIRSHACIDIAPAVFHVGDGGKTSASVSGDVDIDAVLEAAAACPNFAITVTDGAEVLYDPDQS
jgi:ferredoxin